MVTNKVKAWLQWRRLDERDGHYWDGAASIHVNGVHDHVQHITDQHSGDWSDSLLLGFGKL
jgi:hypothetical protein